MNSQIRSILQIGKISLTKIIPKSIPVNVSCQSSCMIRSYCNRALTKAHVVSSYPYKSRCATRGIQTQADKELSEFLVKEIEAENKARRHPKLPKVEGFEITSNTAEIVLTKKMGNEVIKVTVDVNHSVDAEEPQEAEETQSQNAEASELAEMKSKPNFTIEIEKDGKVMSLQCIFNTDLEEEGEASDAFQITELSIYEGDWKDTNYSVSGDIMDGFLYDLLMNMLDERGISNDFAGHLIEYSTSYEHSLYIDLLEKLKNFVSK